MDDAGACLRACVCAHARVHVANVNMQLCCEVCSAPCRRSPLAPRPWPFFPALGGVLLLRLLPVCSVQGSHRLT